MWKSVLLTVLQLLAFGTQVRGFKPGRSRRIFQGEKILNTRSFGREVKPFVPCRIFAACKRTRKCMRGSRSFRSKLPAISRPSSSSFHYYGLWWRHLAVQVWTTKDQGLYNKPSAAVHPGALAAGTLPQYNTLLQNRSFAVWRIFKGEIICSKVYKYVTRLFCSSWQCSDRYYCSALGRIRKIVTLIGLCGLLCQSSGMT